VSKVSSGALEFIPLYGVKFVKPFMQEAQATHNNFKIVSTDIAPVEQIEASKSKVK